MGKKKGRRQDDDDFEAAVQSLDIDDDAAPAHEGESSDLDRLLERAQGVGLLMESELDALTDRLASGETSEAVLLAEWTSRLQAYDDASSISDAPPAVTAPSRRPNVNRVLSSREELDALTREVGGEGIVVVQYWAAWCGQCKKIAAFFESALPAEFAAVAFASVDVDACAEMAERVGAEKLPLFDVLRGGKRIDTLVGAQQTALRKKLLKLAPPPAASAAPAVPAAAAPAADGGAAADGAVAADGVVVTDGGADGAAPAADAAPARVNSLVVIRSAAELQALTAEARAEAAAGEGGGLVVVAYVDAAHGACKKFAPVYRTKLPAEFGDVRFGSVDVKAVPALADSVAGVEEAALTGELPFFDFLKNGKRVDSLLGDKLTALRAKVGHHRAAGDDEKKKKKGRQSKVERVAKGYTVGR